ncbi:M48 family metalloprotease [Xanthomonas vasicola]|uniref:M48 family metalloprotease n=1 Tax=Xanthomonas vasicola TaxID=56459 RepID=UPI0001CBF400|nr:M48 family metalloprotease [Xanthomonas vasicola]KFA10333.1 peptidase [Xanthomonas vasicola pv. musacearum NCPPB 2005]KFA11896.1 peptidase [Xanthomonas vasicola pv. musacearum NCPPB 4380]KFA19195.1 peptidase [Xanthomonas vasicola pv. musacearum NCPPB 4392]KGR40820.2 peptidase [Xanthomonas vasicola]MBV6742926.1 M48 family metalloprotease [Xanthomonas vasicola pv. musacearum NCPPB 2251]
MIHAIAPCCPHAPRTTWEFHLRLLPLATALTLAVAMGVASAQENRLPDIGSSAGELLTPARQAEYGKMMLAELRNYDYVLDDPLITDWLQTMGTRLGANSDQPQQPFTFFMLRDRQINAFATLGGYVAVNAGLVLTAEREDEVAAVLSHEIAHVTQQHVLRGVERAQRDQIPILLGMLAAVVAAQQAGGNSKGDATMATITSAMGLMQQRQIDYTRSNESEADRLGIRTLARSGYDVDAMAGFFERMSVAMRANEGGYSAPDFLQTHPVTVTRISEAKARAEQMKKNTVVLTTSVPGGSRQERVDPSDPSLSEPLSRNGNALLPYALRLPVDALSRGADQQGFDWAKERLRVLSAATPDAAIREYETLRRSAKQGLSDAQRYGLALAKLRNSGGRPGEPVAELSSLLEAHPDNLWLALGLSEAQARVGQREAANARFDALLKQLPNNRAVALTYASALNEQASKESGQRARQVLEPLLHRSSDDPLLQQSYARACELSGDQLLASEAYAEAAFLNGRAEQALIQLEALKKKDLDYVTRARVDARIAAITPTVLELRRQGIRDPDLSTR